MKSDRWQGIPLEGHAGGVPLVGVEGWGVGGKLPVVPV